MFARKNQTDSDLLKVIDSLQNRMLMIDPQSDSFVKMADQLTKLYKLKETTTPKRVSHDTLALIAGNVIGIILILNYERAGIVTSKALSFVMRAR